jgi:hypothetical protein
VRRGLAIRSLSLRACGEGAVLGTLPHGYFDHIDWAADFYSGHCVYDMPARGRVTDLGPAETTVERAADGEAVVRGRIETELGTLEERVRVGADEVVLEYGFAAWGERRLGSLRAAILTLDPQLFGGADLFVRCANGGAPERFALEPPCDHGAGVSAFVSARAAFGATDGRLAIEGGGRALELAWPQDLAAALPLLTVQEVEGRRWCRLAFSLSEVDETHRPGAPLRDFRLTIRGRADAAGGR